MIEENNQKQQQRFLGFVNGKMEHEIKIGCLSQNDPESNSSKQQESQSSVILYSDVNQQQDQDQNQQQQQDQRPQQQQQQDQRPQQQQQRRNYFSFVKKSSLYKGTFEINGRHNECVERMDNVFYVKNLKFPDCVVRNLCQTYKYQGELWFRSLSQQNNDEQTEYETIYEKIHVELNDFYLFIKPLREDEILRKATFYCIADSIKKLKFVKQVLYYGSYSSKTYLPVSDIDMVVYCNVNDQVNFLYVIAERLSFDGIIESKFVIIPSSRVPLLKFNDALTGFPINITLNTPNVMERSQYLRNNIKPNSNQMKILLFLKYYLLSKGTNQVFYGGIGSYALALMVIRFFQEEAAKELIKNEKVFENSILGYLLMGFLERYGDVNFFKNHIISVQDDGEYIECDFNEYGNRHSMNPEKKSSILRIKDHIEPWNDVSYGSFNSAEILKDFQFLHDKFMKADKKKSHSLLGQVLYVVDSFVEYRNLLIFLYKKWFEDCDMNEMKKFPTKTDFQEFIQKRQIFKRTNLYFTESHQEDKSIEYTIETIRPQQPQRSLTVYFDTEGQEYEGRGFKNENHPNAHHINRNNHQASLHANSGILILPIERFGDKVRLTSGGQPYFHHHHHYHNNRYNNKRSRMTLAATTRSSSNSPEPKSESSSTFQQNQQTRFVGSGGVGIGGGNSRSRQILASTTNDYSNVGFVSGQHGR